jgi:hypothetical protein
VLLCLSLGGFSSQGSGLEQSDHREMKTVKLAMSRLLNALITIGCQERVNNNECGCREAATRCMLDRGPEGLAIAKQRVAVSFVSYIYALSICDSNTLHAIVI